MKEETLSLNIQHLADGSLTESDRNNTLQWIEQSAPCYWRDVALAFVEGQILREASASEAELTVLPPLKSTTGAARGWKWAIAAGLAATIFTAGFVASSFNSDTGSSLRSPQSLHVNTNGASVPSTFLGSVAAAKSPAPTPEFDTNAPFSTANDVAQSADAVRKLNAALAPSGYEASLITRYLSQKLDDGGRVVIPVNKVIVRQSAQ